jgi:hypothetical protein
MEKTHTKEQINAEIHFVRLGKKAFSLRRRWCAAPDEV